MCAVHDPPFGADSHTSGTHDRQPVSVSENLCLIPRLIKSTSCYERDIQNRVGGLRGCQADRLPRRSFGQDLQSEFIGYYEKTIGTIFVKSSALQAIPNLRYRSVSRTFRDRAAAGVTRYCGASLCHSTVPLTAAARSACDRTQHENRTPMGTTKNRQELLSGRWYKGLATCQDRYTRTSTAPRCRQVPARVA